MKQLSIVRNMFDSMLIQRINRTLEGIAVIILTVIFLSFLHSEFELLDFDGDNHKVHDYCEIVKDAKTNLNILRDELTKLELNKNLYFNNFEKIEAQTDQTSYIITDYYLKLKQSTDLYLFNRAFLI